MREVEYGTVGNSGWMPEFQHTVPFGWSISASDGRRHSARMLAAHDHAPAHTAAMR